jgi:hypothetical protein
MTCCGGPGSFKQDAEKAWTCFDRLSTNEKSSAVLTPDPFALSLSKGELGLFSRLLGTKHEAIRRLR